MPPRARAEGGNDGAEGASDCSKGVKNCEAGIPVTMGSKLCCGCVTAHLTAQGLQSSIKTARRRTC
jgi:hypothetical protein